MKRLLILGFILLLVAPVAAFSLTFQNTGDFANYVTCYGYGANFPSCYWAQNTTGGNSYIVTYAASGSFTTGYYGIRNTDPELTTYAAASLIAYEETVSSNGPEIVLYDSSGTRLYSIADSLTSLSVSQNPYRYEVVMIGGSAYIYRNGILIAKSGALATNPSYILFGGYMDSGGTGTTCYWDNMIYGSSESKYIFSAPAISTFIIKKDMTNPASSGFAFANGTIISSNNMTTTWGFGSSNESQTVILQDFGRATTACSYTTSYGTMGGSLQWDLNKCIFNNENAYYGYYVTTVLGSNEYSDVVIYIGDGATISFDKEDYSLGDSATITYSILGGYWDTSTYNYRIQVQDIYSNVVYTQTITAQSGSVSMEFESTDNTGVYHAIVIATPKSGGSDIWMNIATAEISGYIRFSGYINNAETCLPISTNYVNITQDGVISAQTTIDGNYSTSASTAFTTGITTRFNVTSSGYQQYNWSFIPLVARTISKNVTLIPASPSFTGVGLNGIISESVYGNPIPSATVAVTNTSYGESYTTSTNICGYYLLDESDAASLTSGRCYLVTASKTGYSSNSALKCVWGA